MGASPRKAGVRRETRPFARRLAPDRIGGKPVIHDL
jgi:hypothetical protein